MVPTRPTARRAGFLGLGYFTTPSYCYVRLVTSPELRIPCRRRSTNTPSFAAGLSSVWPFRSSPSPCPPGSPAARQPPSFRPCRVPFPSANAIDGYLLRVTTTTMLLLLLLPSLQLEPMPYLKSRLLRELYTLAYSSGPLDSGKEQQDVTSRFSSAWGDAKSSQGTPTECGVRSSSVGISSSRSDIFHDVR